MTSGFGGAEYGSGCDSRWTAEPGEGSGRSPYRTRLGGDIHT